MSHAAAAAVRAAAPAGLAVVAFLLLTVSPAPWLGFGFVLFALVVCYIAHRPPQLGVDVAARALLAAGVVAHAAGAGAGAGTGAVATPLLLVTGAALLGVLLAEPLLHRLARPWFATAHLPVRVPAAAAATTGGVAWLVHSAAVAAVGLIAVAGAGPGWLLPVPALAAAGFAGWLAADGVRRWRDAHGRELAPLAAALRRHAPRFALYFSAPPGSTYQATMWLPHLDRLGEPYVVVTPERHNLAPLAAATAAPVVVCETFEAIDAVRVPSLRAVFYVNNGAANAHMVRYADLIHVQLYHGDSDKAVTASPLHALYDRLFVAGQAAVDRFATYGVDIPADRFRIVGRPQVEQLRVAAGPVGEVTAPVVLYAPTWVGAHADSNYCSLPIAPAIVAALLARGATVVLRPHPYSRRHRESAATVRMLEQLLAADAARTGRAHRYGPAATTQCSLFDCMNLAHAMICDVSSVASDFLYTGKPFAITDMTGAGDRFADEFPVARAAYVLRRDAGNLPEVLDDLLGTDPLAAARQTLRGYYLGDAPPQRYAEPFLAAARDVL
jgi:hypothetical protein